RVRPDPPGEAAQLSQRARRAPAAAIPVPAPVCYQWFVAREQRGEQPPAPVPAGTATRRSYDLLRSLQAPADADGSESLVTVLVAFGANVLIAVAKSAAAVVTGSASLLAEAAHSWADTGNEFLLLIANRRSGRPPADGPPGPGRHRIHPGRPAARRRRDHPDQPQPAVPGRRGGRPPGARGGHPGPGGHAGGSPGDLSAAGGRRAADGLGDRRRRSHRR